MKLDFRIEIDLPLTRGKIVEDYLKVLELNNEYAAFTVDDDLNIVNCKGSISSDGSWNYHNNYDDSENVMFVKFENNYKIQRWFTLNKSEAIKIQQENIIKWKEILNAELKRLEEL